MAVGGIVRNASDIPNAVADIRYGVHAAIEKEETYMVRSAR